MEDNITMDLKRHLGIRIRPEERLPASQAELRSSEFVRLYPDFLVGKP